MSTPKVGDRVRVGYEGEVLSNPSYANIVRIKRDDGKNVATNANYITVIEPAYEPGELWIDALGTAYYRMNKHTASSSAWRQVSNGSVCGHERPCRPLTRLVPES